jgi:hypothetical protein
MATPWQDLEIEPTSDVLAIRRAYRARLRRTRPEDAARLQAAYEGAIAASPEVPPPMPAPLSAGAEGASGLMDDDAVALARRIADGRMQGSLTLRDDIEAVERLLTLLVRDRALRAAQIDEAARLLGWLDDKSELPAGPAFDPLRARVAAERWFAGLSAAAARRRPFDGEASAARRLLGLENRFERLAVPRAALASLLADFDRHRPWLEDRFDAAHLAETRRAAGAAGD